MLVVYLANPDTGSGFYIARQNDSTSMYDLYSLVTRHHTTQQHEAAIVLSGSSGKLSSNPLIRFRNPVGKSASETIVSVRSGLRGL